MKNSSLASGFAFFPSPLTQEQDEQRTILPQSTSTLPIKKISVKGKEEIMRTEQSPGALKVIRAPKFAPRF